MPQAGNGVDGLIGPGQARGEAAGQYRFQSHMVDDMGAKGAVKAGDSGDTCGKMKGIETAARHLYGKQLKPFMGDRRAMVGDPAGDGNRTPRRLERARQLQPVGAEIPILGDEKKNSWFRFGHRPIWLRRRPPRPRHSCRS